MVRQGSRVVAVSGRGGIYHAFPTVLHQCNGNPDPEEKDGCVDTKQPSAGPRGMLAVENRCAPLCRPVQLLVQLQEGTGSLLL